MHCCDSLPLSIIDVSVEFVLMLLHLLHFLFVLEIPYRTINIICELVAIPNTYRFYYLVILLPLPSNTALKKKIVDKLYIYCNDSVIFLFPFKQKRTTQFAILALK